VSIEFEYAEVEQYCNELHSISNRIKEILENSSNEIKKIQSGENWTGPASDKCVDKFNKVSKSFSDVSDTLDSVVLFIAQCSKNYNSIDNKVINEIKSNINIS